MKNEKIIEVIVDKINAGYDEDDLERFLERKEIKTDEFNSLIEAAKAKILEHQLQIYPKQNKRVFIVWLSLFVVFVVFFVFILPVINIPNEIILLSILGAVAISFSGFKSILYYKSWEKSFIERVGKPKFDFQNYLLLFSLPTILFYFMISWSYVNGPGQNLYKIHMTIKFIKSLLP